MPKAAKVHINRENVRRLMEGKSVTVRIPPDVNELQLTMDPSDQVLRNIADQFASVGHSQVGVEFTSIFEQLFRR